MASAIKNEHIETLFQSFNLTIMVKIGIFSLNGYRASTKNNDHINISAQQTQMSA
jgi:hypothetical protein